MTEKCLVFNDGASIFYPKGMPEYEIGTCLALNDNGCLKPVEHLKPRGSPTFYVVCQVGYI